MNIAENIDCMEGMKRYPDKYFDLAVVDPPYGGGSSQSVHVERERERESCRADTQILKGDGEAGSGAVLTSTISACRTGGTWDVKYRDRTRRRISGIGILRRKRNILTSWRGSASSKSFGAGTISDCRRQGVFWYGIK